MKLPIAGTSESVELGSFRDFYAFEQHVKTARARRGLDVPEAWYRIPAFYFSNHRSIITDGDPVHPPASTNKLDYELELGLVIGMAGRDIPPTDAAWDHVLGLTIINDWSARDLQREEMQIGLGPAKGKDFATSAGPAIIPLTDLRPHIKDGKLHATMTACVNGVELSRGNAQDMHYTWPELIAHASRDADLKRGDLLGSGTVGTGCILELGPETHRWLQPGDEVTLTIEHIGSITNTIAQPTAAPAETPEATNTAQEAHP